jgi:alpha-1,2-mannosyltransferase
MTDATMIHPARPTAAERGLALWETVSVLLLIGVLVWFGFLTHYRSTRVQERMTDFGVYTRAAWAVRTGLNPYDTPDDRGWHYLYPPTFVLMMLPLADPIKGSDRTGYLPYSTSVAIWYVLNVLLLFLTVHLLAKTALPDALRFSRRWWYARLIPLDIGLLALGYTLSRGQVNIVVLLCLALLLFWRNKAHLAGWCLALACAIKVLPGLLIAWPVLTKRWGILLGLVLGSAVFLFCLPTLAWGPNGAVEMNKTFLSRVAAPSVTNTGDSTIHKEFSGTTSTDSQALQAIVHAWRYPVRLTRPDTSDSLTKGFHYGVGLLLLGITALVGWKQRAVLMQPIPALLFVGALCVLMVHIAPASHMHYYSYSLILLTGLTALDLQRHPTRAVPTARTMCGLVLWMILTGIPLIDSVPVCNLLRDFGLSVAANLGLWAWGLWELRRGVVANEPEA